ncbi:hypothetical protein S83_012202, partial [Arachis hypogaea]
RRFEIFKDNLRFIYKHNSTGNKPYKLGLNKFSNFNNEEYRARELFGILDSCCGLESEKYKRNNEICYKKAGLIMQQSEV